MYSPLKLPIKGALVASIATASSVSDIQPSWANETQPLNDHIESTVSIHRMKRNTRHLTDTESVCRLRVDFGSYASGIDGEVFARVMGLITYDNSISEIFMFPWGMEGEITLCVQILNDEDGKRIFETIKFWIPAETRNGQTKVTYDRKSHISKWPN
ncbi:hypothetical protein IWQ55_003058 [Labrenzia sp. EL_208]|nr:hypothetical protein [Labrenzia sp. EL_132]MBG6229845.1 hypothetical protein [Labrenzia sp. EL_208]